MMHTPQQQQQLVQTPVQTPQQHQSLASHFHLYPVRETKKIDEIGIVGGSNFVLMTQMVEKLADVIENGTRDQNSDALVC